MIGSGINQKICWPTEFDKGEQGTWKLNTHKISQPVFKGIFDHKTV